MSDDGFHEIQLNGKQLVFLFMAATVVSVVIFLCGVMVGRGVRSDRADATSGPNDLAASAPAAAPAPIATLPPSNAKPPANAIPPSPEDESATSALTAKKPEDLTLTPRTKPAAAKPGPANTEKPPVAEKPVEKPAAAPKPAAPAHVDTAKAQTPIAPPASPTTVTSGGFAVQITALRDRSEADAIVKRLASKGYPAYVVNPLPGKPPVYRVQVGRFQDRAEADRIASRLQKEEQFSPWVTR
jgi:cell division septation protein DedD